MPPQQFDPSKPFEAAPPFDPSKPFEPVAVGAHPEAKMSAAQPGLAWAGEADDQSVTLGDVLHDPVDAIARIGKNVGREVSDPKLWLSLVAGYFGPKAVDAVLPTVASAARATMRGGAAAAKSSPELVGILSPRIGNAMKVARNVGQAVMQGEAPAEAPPVEAPQPPVRQPSPREVTQAAREAYRAANPVPSAPPVAPPAETAAPSPSTPQSVPAAAPAPAQAPPAAPAAAAPTSVPEAFKAAQAAFATAGETPRLAEVNNVAKLIQRGQPPEQALKVVVGNRPGSVAAAPAQPLSPVEDLAQRFNARQAVPSPLQRMQEELLQGGSAEAEFARKYAAKQATLAQPEPATVPTPAPEPTPPEPAKVVPIKRTPKAKATVVDAPPSAADTPAAAAERVIDVAGAVTGKDVQGRVVSALTEELANAQQAAKFKTIEFSAGRPSSGSYGRIMVDDQPVAYVDKYGTIKWFDEPTSYTTAQGQRVAAPESPHGKMSLEGRMDEKTPGQIAREATTQVARQLGKEQGAGLLRVQIPGDGTFTVERNPHAIGELIRRISAGGPSIWQGVGDVKFSAPKVGPTIPKATW